MITSDPQPNDDPLPIEGKQSLSTGERRELTQDLRLIGRAIKHRWPITPKKRKTIINRLMQVIEADNAREGHIIQAANAIIMADSISQRDEKLQFEREARRTSQRADVHVHGDAIIQSGPAGASDDGATEIVARIDEILRRRELQERDPHGANGNGANGHGNGRKGLE